MIRENRYIVIKRKDAEKYLTQEQVEQLERLAEIIEFGRYHSGKNWLTSVVVEDDWPEYEIVWKMIEDRVDGVE